jgi:hypothetical protein
LHPATIYYPLSVIPQRFELRRGVFGVGWWVLVRLARSLTPAAQKPGSGQPNSGAGASGGDRAVDPKRWRSRGQPEVVAVAWSTRSGGDGAADPKWWRWRRRPEAVAMAPSTRSGGDGAVDPKRWRWRRRPMWLLRATGGLPVRQRFGVSLGLVCAGLLRLGRTGIWGGSGVIVGVVGPVWFAGAYLTPSGKRLPRCVGVVRGGCVCVAVRVGLSGGVCQVCWWGGCCRAGRSGCSGWISGSAGGVWGRWRDASRQRYENAPAGDPIGPAVLIPGRIMGQPGDGGWPFNCGQSLQRLRDSCVLPWSWWCVSRVELVRSRRDAKRP